MRNGPKSLLLLLLSGPLSLAFALIIGIVFRFDGQSSFLVLPFLLVFWITSPASIILTIVMMRTKGAEHEQNTQLYIALAILNAVLLVVLLWFM